MEPDTPRTAEEADPDLARRRLHERIQNDFTYHPPSTSQVSVFHEVREEARRFAELLIHNVPPGRELSTALTRLEECVMHANAGIARHG